MRAALCFIKLLLFASFTACSFAVDTPERILTEYQDAEDSVLSNLNSTLEKAAVTLIADLVKSGDTVGAALLKEQLEAKMAGVPVPKPQRAGETLFKNYDSARSKALMPLKQASLRRINNLLNSSEGKKLEVVSALTKVREEIESDSALPKNLIPSRWTYHTTEFGNAMGELILRSDGTFDLLIPTSSSPQETGKWKPSRKHGELFLFSRNEKWTVTFSGDEATLERPSIVGIRFLKKAP